MVKRSLVRKPKSFGLPMIDLFAGAMLAIFLILLVYVWRNKNAPVPPPEPVRFPEEFRAPPMVQGMNYLFDIPTIGGAGRLRFTISGDLPDGVVSDEQAGVLVGNPTVTPTWTTRREVAVTVVVEDEVGSTDRADLRLYLYPVAIAADPSSPKLSLQRESLDLPPARLNRVYEAVLGATGGVGPYKWTYDPKKLPSGMNIVDGRLVGEPTVAGPHTFVVTVTHSSGEFRHDLMVKGKAVRWKGGESIRTYHLAVFAEPDYRLVLPEGRVSEDYTGGLLGIQGEPGTTVSWTENIDGVAPSADGFLLSGKPESVGPYKIECLVRDRWGKETRLERTIRILPEVAVELGAAAFNAYRGESFEFAVPYRGMEPVVLNLIGTPPAWLRIEDGTLKGTPKAVGVFEVEVRVTDAWEKTTTGKVSVRVGTRF